MPQVADQLVRRGVSRRVSTNAVFQPTEDDKDALWVIHQRYHPEEATHAILEKTWVYNLAFTIGHQYHTWSDSLWALVYRPKSPRWRVREIRNMIRAFVERRISTLTSPMPKWRNRPNSSDIEDQQAARIGEKILEHYWKSLDMPLLRQELLYWMVVTGNAFLKTYWDPGAGNSWADVDTDPMTGQPKIILNERNEPELAQRLFFDGDVRSEVVAPFEFFCDPVVPRMDDHEWCMQVTRRPLAWVDRHFPERAPFVKADGGEESQRSNYRNALNLVGPGGFSASGTQGERTWEDWVTVKEYFERPSNSFPQGRLILEANGIILQNGPNPCPKGVLPFVHFMDLPVPGRFWGQSNVDNLITPQRNYNRIVSKYIEHIILTTAAKVLYPTSAGIPDTVWDNKVGEFINYSGNQPPSYLIPPPLPSQSDTEMNRIRGDFDIMTNTFGPERGQYQGKLSGRAIDLLVEQGAKSKEPIIERLANSFEKWGQMVLEEFQANADEQRTIKITGRRNSFDVQSFRGADLAGNTDVTVELSSLLPRSRTLALNELQIMAGIGLLDPMNPEHRAKGWQMLQMESDEEVVEEMNIHRRNAQLENQLLLRGQYVSPNWYEDHDAHVAEHRVQMNSDEYKMAPVQIKVLFERHMLETGRLANPQIGATLPAGMQQQLAAPPREQTSAEGGSKGD